MRSLKVNGLLEKLLDKEEANKYGQTVLCMKVGGKIIKQMEREDLYMLMEMFMMECG
jgi:hypothetical protein